MSERGAFRGRGGGGGRGGDRGGRGGGRGGGQQGGGASGQTERPKKENILDLSKYMDKQITVKFSGGREGIAIAPYRGCAVDCLSC
jgi:U6 snRNA-associated Sm-like protein LSm7